MKRSFFTVPALFLSALMLMSCGKSDITCPAGQIAQNNTCVMAGQGYGYYGNGYGQTGYNGYNTCQNGTFQTQYGCLPRGNCPVNQAFYSQTNQCVQVTNTYTGGGTTGQYPYGNGTCQNGAIPTYLGCLYQGSCPQGMAYSPQYNTCVQAQMGGYGGGFGAGVGISFGTCSMGYSYTSYGCLPQGNCPYGMGYFNGYCIR